MMATLNGAIVSDQLEDGRIVSGVGGQFNFVAMAHAIPDAKLIMAIRATRGSGKTLRSNIVFNYGHCTVPKYWRDIVVTEYGIAHLRGLSEEQVTQEMIKVADSRFQKQLLEKAKSMARLKRAGRSRRSAETTILNGLTLLSKNTRRKVSSSSSPTAQT
jgi:acyl-CoA hydrolase